MNSSRIIGVGSYLPNKIISNDELASKVDTSNEWIIERTGIKQRHIAAQDQYTSDLAYQAAIRAINNAGIEKNQIDVIILATTTPDLTFPATAAKVQAKLAISAVAFDIQAVCAGFIYALNIADNFIKTNQYSTVLVIGADKMSSLINWQDRASCVLFGDGAGAVILTTNIEQSTSKIIATNLYSDGNFVNILQTSGGASSNQQIGQLTMAGKEVFRHGVEKMATSIEKIINENNFTKDQIDLVIPHQANIRIIDAIAKKLNMDDNKLFSSVSKHANTSAASIPLALDLALMNKKLKADDLLVLTAFGAGLSWGASLIRW